MNKVANIGHFVPQCLLNNKIATLQQNQISVFSHHNMLKAISYFALNPDRFINKNIKEITKVAAKKLTIASYSPGTNQNNKNVSKLPPAQVHPSFFPSL